MISMQNFKFHLLSITSVIIFSYSFSFLIINLLINSFSTIDNTNSKSFVSMQKKAQEKKYTVDDILRSNFFNITSEDVNVGISAGSVDELKLLGTVVGPDSISRAMILKRGEKQSEVFRRWKDVYGYRLIAINMSNVKLKKDGEIYTLNLFDDKNFSSGSKIKRNSNGSNTVTKRISKSEIQQKVLNNLDNAMKGLRAGPYRKNGKIEGYRLIRVRPYNILYKYGIRSGDILKRVNGIKIDSTEKLYSMWQGVKQQTTLNVDIDRRGKIITYNIKITD